jgi:hypothetical protein
VDGRGSITATSFKRGTGGVIFFTVFIRTSNPGVVEARIVELPAFSSSVGDAVLSEPQPCEHGELVGFNDDENLTAQLSVAPPLGCSNSLTLSPLHQLPLPYLFPRQLQVPMRLPHWRQSQLPPTPPRLHTGGSHHYH